MRKISYKLGLTLISLFIALTFLIGHVFDGLYVNFYVDHLEKDLYFRTQNQAKILAEYFDQQTLDHVAMMEAEVETSVVVINANGDVLIASKPIDFEQKKYLNPISANRSSKDFSETDWRNTPYIVTKSPIMANDKLLGTVIMFSPTAPIQHEVNEIHLAVTLFGISTIILSSFIIILFSKQITLPLIKIKQMTQQIAKGNYQVQLPVKGKDEITDLTIAINSMSNELLHYEASRNEFLSNISHELRTPLMHIKGYADLLIQDRIENPGVRKEYLEIISEETLRVQYLVKDLFDLTKYRDGKIKIHREKTDIVHFMKEIVKRIQYQMEKKQITCYISSVPEVIVCLVDPERMEQVTMNLLENAITYTPENGKILIRLFETKSAIIIEIEDNGIGITEKELPLIWERFYRVEKSRSRNYGGTGLGLPIAKEIVKLHGGDITVKSVEGEGSIFIIRLPVCT